MLIDFDDRVKEREARFEQEIPEDLKPRVFLVGPKDGPETLKGSLRLGYEKIGDSLATDCDANTTVYWAHDQLKHNDVELQRLVQSVKPFLF